MSKFFISCGLYYSSFVQYNIFVVGGVKELAILATVIVLALAYDRVRVSAIFF